MSYNQSGHQDGGYCEEYDNMNNFGEKVSFIWSVADLLLGPCRQNQYKDIMLPIIVLHKYRTVLISVPLMGKIGAREKVVA